MGEQHFVEVVHRIGLEVLVHHESEVLRHDERMIRISQVSTWFNMSYVVARVVISRRNATVLVDSSRLFQNLIVNPNSDPFIAVSNRKLSLS
jgi:hypothetical protein